MSNVQTEAPAAPAAQSVTTTVSEPPAASAPEPAPPVVGSSEPHATPAPAAPAPPAAPSKPARPAAPAAAPLTPTAKAVSTTSPVPRPVPPKLPVAAAAMPAPAPEAPQPKATPPAVAATPATATLDLKSLETRLRETSAIGVFTKISLKNQVDDLLTQFRAYHKHQATTTLADLRQAYNLLLLKVLALLQDTDPALARDIVASRDAIWGILSDPKRFAESNLMAGVTP